MRYMVSIAVTLMALFGFAALGIANAAQLDPSRTKDLADDVLREVSVIPEVPHFLGGITPRDDPWEQFLEVNKVFQTKGFSYGRTGRSFIDKGNDDYFLRNDPEHELSETLVLGGKTVHLLYSHHFLREDGMFTFRSRLGEKNLAEFSPLYEKYRVQWALGTLSLREWQSVQHVLGWAEAESLQRFIRSALEWAVAKNVHDYHEVMNITESVIAYRETIDPDFRGRLDQPVPGSGGLTLRDYIPVPDVRPEAFLPDLLVIGPGQFIGGFVNSWKKPGTETIAFVDLRAFAIGYVSGEYRTLSHELVHANSTLQGIPWSAYFDVEVFAEATTYGMDNLWNYLRHPYVSLWRYLAKTYFGFDSEEVLRRLVADGGIRFGPVDLREEEFRRYTAEVERVNREFRRFITDPEDGLMVVFYSDPLFWSTVNTTFCDSVAAVRLLFALQYEPAGLFNPDKKDEHGVVIPPAVQTREWLVKEEAAGRIASLAKQAMDETGNITERGKELVKEGEWDGTGACPVDTMFLFPHVSHEEERRIVSFLTDLYSRAKKGDREAELALYSIFGERFVRTFTR